MDFNDMSWSTQLELTHQLGVSIANTLLSDKTLVKELAQVIGEAIGEEIAKTLIQSSIKEQI